MADLLLAHPADGHCPLVRGFEREEGAKLLAQEALPIDRTTPLSPSARNQARSAARAMPDRPPVTPKACFQYDGRAFSIGSFSG